MSIVKISEQLSRTSIHDKKKPSTNAGAPHVWEKVVWRSCKIGDSFYVKDYLKDADEQRRSTLVSSRDSNGNTALILASGATHIHGGCVAIVETLLKYGANINAQNCQGRTALMEASLWGGLKAVEKLLECNVKPEVDITLKDNKGSTAIDLAGLGEEHSLERRKRRLKGEHKENPYADNQQRKKIVRLLQTRYDRYIDSMKAELEQARLDKQRLSEEVEELQSRLRQKDAELQQKNTKFRRMQQGLDDKGRKLCLEETTNFKIRDQLDSAQHRIKILCRPGFENEIRFRENKLQDGTLDTAVELIRTFRFPPRENFWSSKMEHSRPTIACLVPNDPAGSYHLAKNGEIPDERFISGKEYSGQADTLFTALGFTDRKSYFKHAEPQLMAYHVEQYCIRTKISLYKFLNEEKPYKASSKVEIFVSRLPCDKCEELKDLINNISRNHGFEFVLKFAGTRV